MRSLIFALATLALLHATTEAKRKNWALLIAGSKTWYNYRHQSDICRAYHIFNQKGIPDEQIVVMMYDDIANNPRNPVKGNIINVFQGPNVYPGVPKDYTGDEVNVETFLAALQGDKEKVRYLTGENKKVIDSGPEDHIFVSFAGIGGKGVLGMPSTPYLKGKDLIEVLKSMHAKKRFAQMVFYVESRESGSNFEDLPKDINVYVTTSANPNERIITCYLDQYRKTCTGDLFSTKWMKDTENAAMDIETFKQQYKKVVPEVLPMSHVMQYGDTSIADSTLDKFFAKASDKPDLESYSYPSVEGIRPSQLVSSQTQKQNIEEYPLKSVESANLQELKLAEEEMKAADDLFTNIAKTVYRDLPDEEIENLAFREHSPIKNWDCYGTAVDALCGLCPGIDRNNEFALRKFYVLNNLCNDQKEEKVISAIDSAIAHSPFCFENLS